MLILSRKVGEQIIINDEIRVSVVRVQGNRCQIGIEAPAHIRIERQEIRDARETPAVDTSVGCLN
jgi:carbon storage regulator